MTSLRNTRVLVTGGAGFIGSHLSEQLVKIGARVTVADNFSRGSLSNIRHIKKQVALINVDLRTEEGARRATKNQSIVFNLAAVNTGVDFDIGRTQYMFEENVLLQMMPIRAAAINHVDTFIQVSSASIYSTLAMEKHVPTTESDDQGQPEQSKLGYALAKRAGENLASWYAENSKMRTVVARFINVYGTGDNFDNLGHFVPTIIRKFINSDNSVEVFGSGNQKRSFLHVDDAVSALLLLARKGANGQAYNIDPQEEHAVKEIVLAIQKIMRKQNVHLVFNRQQPEGSKRRMLDNTKIKHLGWKPNHSLLPSLPELIKDIVSRDEA
jgi:nucleoside-diphosphate-sugar epimerase